MKIKVKSPQSKSLPQTQQIKALPAQEGFITKFIRVILDDIKTKLYQFKYRFIVENSDEHQKWEDFEQFCKMARGER